MTSERTMIGTPPKKKPTHAVIAEGKAETANSIEEAERLAVSQVLSGKRAFVALLLREFRPSVQVEDLLPPPGTIPPPNPATPPVADLPNPGEGDGR